MTNKRPSSQENILGALVLEPGTKTRCIIIPQPPYCAGQRLVAGPLMPSLPPCKENIIHQKSVPPASCCQALSLTSFHTSFSCFPADAMKKWLSSCLWSMLASVVDPILLFESLSDAAFPALSHLYSTSSIPSHLKKQN